MPIFPKPIDLAANYVWTGDHTFDGVVTCNGDFNAVDGSFTGTLTSEVGGSYKLYNLGDESANDSEYLSMGYDANKAELLSVSEGAGVNRTFRVGGYVGVAFRGVELDTASGSFKWLYNNAQQLAITSNTCTFNSSTMIAKDVRVNNIRPTVDNSYDCGLDAFRWRTTYSVDGSFSGTLKTEGFKTGVAATTQAAITLSDTDNTLLADCTSNNVVVSLPASAGNDGLQYTIKKVDGSANYCSVTPNGAETIDGQSGLTITGQYESVNLVCYSGEWYLV